MARMNERKTEDLVENRLREQGYFSSEYAIAIEKQQSDDPRIEKLLIHASKSGDGPGKPEFIIHSQKFPQFLIVIECKADPAKHESDSHTKFKDYAVDGVLLYAAHLSKEYDVVAVAASGQDEATFRLSHFLHLRGANNPVGWEIGDDIVSLEDYFDAFISSDIKFRQDYHALLDYSRKLNNQLQSKKITEAQRGFLISGILLALKNRAFEQSFGSHQTARQLTTNLLTTIEAEFENAAIPEIKREVLVQSFSFIRTLPIELSFLVDLIGGINENINSFIKTHKYYDTIGQFYVEFLRYANNDKGLGIVLTPYHIAELFVHLADVNQDSIVFDNCCGTAGLLIAAMRKMVQEAGANRDKIKQIKNQQLFGIEFQPNIFALAVCNMILHDDGKANVMRGDCFLHDSRDLQYKNENGRSHNVRPTVGLLNPPYKNKRIKDDPEELEFVLNNLEFLDRDKGGRCIAIVPITCATNPSGAIGELKRRLLDKHTLEAVMSMPIDLFHNSKTTVVTCVMVFTAHRPHPVGKKTWFGYWRDDGFVKTRHLGRIDMHGTWPATRDRWINAFVNREVSEGLSITKEVGAHDEWCAEAYLTVNYELVDSAAFAEASRRHFVYEALSKYSR